MFKKKPPQAAAPVPKVAPVPVDQIRVEDKLYSTEKLAELHPGGPIFIRVRSQDELKGDGLVDLQCQDLLLLTMHASLTLLELGQVWQFSGFYTADFGHVGM